MKTIWKFIIYEIVSAIIGSIIQFYISKKVENMNIKQILDIGILICVFLGAIIFAIYMLIKKIRLHSLYIKYFLYITNYYNTKSPNLKPSSDELNREFNEKELIELGFSEFEVKKYRK